MAIAALAQTEPARVDFEVVSIKLGDPNDPASSARGTPGRMEWRNTTLANLIRNAYGLNEHQLEGGPKWMNSDRFHVDAKLPAGAPRDQMPLMMRSMLADRFHLEFHRVTKEHSVYNLVVAGGGPKIQPAAENEPQGGSSQGPRQIKGKGVTVADLARMLISAVGAPVFDRTGLQGKYTFALEFAPQSGAREDETLPSIFTVLQERLGLKLESGKAPIEVLVVDRAERPTEN
jgi:uncharacterized protein (TIGR03435 family)